MRLLICVVSALLTCAAEGNLSTLELGPTPQDGNFSRLDLIRPEPPRLREHELDSQTASAFNLKVQVTDKLSRQHLSQAAVEVYVNYTRTLATLTGEDGGVLLHVPHQPGVPVTVVASRDGYVCTLLPCSTSRMPIFSSVTMSLLRATQGNIWLFEDSLLISDKISDASPRPTVQFPKRLLNMTDDRGVTSLKAFLTFPKLPSEEENFLTTGIMSSKSGYVSVQLRPVAAVSAQLFSGDSELHVSGPIRIILSLPDNCGLDSSTDVPAWLYNRTTGGWMRQGLGRVESVDGKLSWTFLAPQLGYWIAAPLAPASGIFGLVIPSDFVLNYSSFLMVLLGGLLFVLICLLVGIFSYRRSSSDTKSKQILPMSRRDQSTSTRGDEEFHVCSGDASNPEDSHSNSVHNGDILANLNDGGVTLDCTSLDQNSDSASSKLEPLRVPTSLTESLLFYNQPVAILHASAFFHVEEPVESPRSRSATLPRPSAKESESQGDSQTPPRTLPVIETPPAKTENRLTVPEASRTHGGLQESASVPQTLNKIRDNRHSLHAGEDLSKIPTSQPPRAWFVSLEGKPAAEIRYAVEQQRRRRPAESRDTSLDSGVDLSELNQAAGRRAVTLERNATFVKSRSDSKNNTSE
ncbi:protein FAM171B-like [Synchiropus splendidus]|uniref:protein FAM171B-like n=1 Tax=Synchiropus splendidus TaxID=270530 RepID=UPI00237D37FC|nr:protein FAM171B-like [Synchiropus splendidus]